MRTTLKNSFLFALIALVCSFSTNILAQTQSQPQAKKIESKKEESKKEEGKVIHLNKEEFQKRVFNFETSKEWKYLGDKPCVLDFYANWCGPCRMISPFLDELAEEFKGKIYIYKINTDQEKELASMFGASSIPLLIFIPMNGQPQASRGALPKDEIRRAIETVLLGKK
jgi:thioredoxin